MDEKYINKQSYPGSQTYQGHQGHQGHQGRHRIIVDNRERIDVSGVINVESFDDQEIILETEQGLLAMRGEEMHIKNLNLEKGELQVEGFLLEMAYSEKKGFLRKERGKSFFERLFK